MIPLCSSLKTLAIQWTGEEATREEKRRGEAKGEKKRREEKKELKKWELSKKGRKKRTFNSSWEVVWMEGGVSICPQTFPNCLTLPLPCHVSLNEYFTPFLPLQCWRFCNQKEKGYEKRLFITNPDSVPSTSTIYILPFKHCYNTLVLLFQQNINLYTPNETPGSTYLSIPSRSLCNIRLTTARIVLGIVSTWISGIWLVKTLCVHLVHYELLIHPSTLGYNAGRCLS